MKRQKKRGSYGLELELEQIFVIDTCFTRTKKLWQIKKLSQELTSEERLGGIIVSNTAVEELNRSYTKLKRKKGCNRKLKGQDKKDFIELERATSFIDEQRKNPVWVFGHPEEFHQVKKLQADPRIFFDLKRDPSNNDLRILATARAVHRYYCRGRKAKVYVVTNDWGLKRAASIYGIKPMGDLRGLWPFYRKVRSIQEKFLKIQARLGLRKNNNNKGD